MNTDIQDLIASLVCYGLATDLIGSEDAVFVANELLDLLGIHELSEKAQRWIMEFEVVGENHRREMVARLESILTGIGNYALEHGLIESGSVLHRDLFETKMMALMTQRPSEVNARFLALYKESPSAATDWFYRMSEDNGYIRRYRIARDQRWKVSTVYGELDITINLSKPEKDPAAIAAAKNAPQTEYPKCLLCRENVGYAGHALHPARQNHRMIPVMVDGGGWYYHYSPYVYYPEHCIVVNGIHQPMKIDRGAFRKLFEFVHQFPHYFVGSNADLPIVGGSILSHEHFQGGNYEFAMARAPIETPLVFGDFEHVRAGIVKWPMAVIRISCEEYGSLVDLADLILGAWREYTDEEAFIYARTEGEDHNTITPIARMRGGRYEMDLVLRNNITTPEHPLGVYHPHSELHHIKKENIGLIETMGLAVLPARLKQEMQDLMAAIRDGRDISQDEELGKHAEWLKELQEKYPGLGRMDPGELEHVLHEEIGHVFSKVLEHAGVYKRDEAGRAAFLRFIKSVNGRPV